MGQNIMKPNQLGASLTHQGLSNSTKRAWQKVYMIWEILTWQTRQTQVWFQIRITSDFWNQNEVLGFYKNWN
jgi:hypothetical protein